MIENAFLKFFFGSSRQDQALIQDHSPAAVAKRLAGGSRSYLRDWVYGGIDGAVTTFAVVSGVVGAGLAPGTILILGIANLVADGFSMAAANYVGTKAELEELQYWKEFETRQIENNPEGETEEVRQILAGHGLSGEPLEQAVKVYVGNKLAWLRLMLMEEYGLSSRTRGPVKAAMATFIAFLVCGAVPLLPFVLESDQPFLVACTMTGFTFFAIGSLKSRWSTASWWRSGAVTLSIGAVASALAYGTGALIGEIVNP